MSSHECRLRGVSCLGFCCLIISMAVEHDDCLPHLVKPFAAGLLSCVNESDCRTESLPALCEGESRSPEP